MHDLVPPDRDHEGKMARADLFKLAQYSFKLFKMLDDNQQLDGWVQAKITKSADYIASVYHYLEYEMKFSDYGQKLENSDVYVESIRNAYAEKLMEAKKKMDKLKAAIEKKDKVEEGFDDLEKYMKDKKGPQPSGGAGKKSGTRYGGSKQQADDSDDDKPHKAASKYADRKPKKEKKVEEGWDDMLKAVKDRAGPQPSGGSGIKKGSRYGGSKQVDAPEKDDDDEKQKKSKKVKEASKPDYLDFDKDGNKKEPMKKALKDKKVKEVAMSPAPAQKKSGIPSTATTTVPGMKATPADLKKANSSAALGEGKCNQTMEGKSCPVHGMKECPMSESTIVKESTEVARLKELTKRILG